MNGIKYTDITQYHRAFSKEIQLILDELRAIICETAPQSVEKISYNMPSFHQQGVLVYYAAYKNHIGFYPTSTPIVAFKEDLAEYKTSKGAIHFPLNKPLPKKLIERIVQFKLEENSRKQAIKKKKT